MLVLVVVAGDEVEPNSVERRLGDELVRAGDGALEDEVRRVQLALQGRRRTERSVAGDVCSSPFKDVDELNVQSQVTCAALPSWTSTN